MKNNIPKELRNSAGIYEILNTANGKRYVGSTSCFTRRVGRHRRELGRGDHSNRALQSSVNKYGKDSFEINAIIHVPQLPNETKECHMGRLIDVEDIIINICKSNQKQHGYNQRIVAGSNLGLPLPPDDIRRIKGRKMSDEFREKISIAFRGDRHPNALINNEVAKQIKIMLANGASVAQIAVKFNIKKINISQIKAGRLWRHTTISQLDIDSFDKAEILTIGKRNLTTDEVKLIKYLWDKGVPNSTVAHYLGILPGRIRQIRKFGFYSEVQLNPIDFIFFDKQINLDDLKSVASKYKHSNRTTLTSREN